MGPMRLHPSVCIIQQRHMYEVGLRSQDGWQVATAQHEFVALVAFPRRVALLQQLTGTLVYMQEGSQSQTMIQWRAGSSARQATSRVDLQQDQHLQQKQRYQQVCSSAHCIL